MNIKEIEQKIHKINNSKVVKKIRLSYRESDELDEFYIDVWLENISKFLADGRKVNTEFDVCKEVAKEIIEFANYSERTYAAALYDFVRYFLINKLNLDHLSDWFKVTDYFDNIAIEVDNGWPKILDVFDDFTLSELEEFLETGFELISHPTCDTLMDIDITENRLLEMRYIISVGLFILYENHNIDDMLMNESFLEQSIEKRNDRNYVIEALRQNGLIYKHIETKFKADEELALIAIEQDSDVVVEEMLPMELIEDGDFIEKVIRIQPLLITYFLGNKDYDILIHKKLLFIAIEEIGVDALWEMDSEIFKDIDIIVAALKSTYGQHIWEAILYDAGTEYSKKIIEAGYNLYGDKVLALNYSSLTNDRQVVESVISIDGHLLKFVNQEFKMDKGIIEKAILNDADSFRFIPESLKDDRSFVLELASINGNILSKLNNDLKNDKEIVRLAMLQDFHTLEYASDRLRNNKEFIFSVLNEYVKLQNENKEIMDSILKDFEEPYEKNIDSYNEYWVQYDKLYDELAKKYNIGNSEILHGVSDVLKSDKEFVLDILKIDPWSVRSLSETLKSDKDVMQIVFVSHPYLLEHYYSDKTLDRDFAIDAININQEVLKYFDISIRNDFEIVKLAVLKNGELLNFASDELKNNREIVSLAVSNYPSALNFASNDLKNDKEIVRHAMLQDFDTLEYASDRLRNDKEFIFSVLNENVKLTNENEKIMDSIIKDFEYNFEKNEESKNNYLAQKRKLYDELAKKYNIGNSEILHGVSDVLKSDKEFVLDILKIDPWSVRSISETLKSDKNVMQIVFVSQPYLLEHCYSDKTMDRDFAIDAININPKVLSYVDISFRNDFEIVKLAVSKNGELLNFASDELKNNREIVSSAVRNSPSALGFASNELKKDEEFLGLFYDYIAGEDPHTFMNYFASLELFMSLPEKKQRDKQLLLCFTRDIWYYDDLYISKYKSLIMKYHSNDIKFIKQCMILEEYNFSFLTLIDYNSVKEDEDLMIAAIQADIRNKREPIIWGGNDLVNNVNFLKKVIEISPLYLSAIKSNENILEAVKLKF